MSRFTHSRRVAIIQDKNHSMEFNCHSFWSFVLYETVILGDELKPHFVAKSWISHENPPDFVTKDHLPGMVTPMFFKTFCKDSFL